MSKSFSSRVHSLFIVLPAAVKAPKIKTAIKQVTLSKLPIPMMTTTTTMTLTALSSNPLVPDENATEQRVNKQLSI
jgi:hypothetical protein